MNKKFSNYCSYCGLSIPFQDRKGNQPKYCSEEHRKEWLKQYRQKYRETHEKKKWKPDVVKKCPVCLKEFVPWSVNQTYCSHSCSSKISNESRKKPLPKCEACGKEVKEHGRRFCSRECKVEWYKGEEVYNYLSGQAREHYASSFWLELAEKIRERDGHRCRRCNCLPRKGRKHDVHHVEPYRVSQNDNEENLITLCKKCHKIVENMTWKELGIGTPNQPKI